MENNIHGHCPHCNANLDDDLIINYPLSQGKSMEEALRYAASYSGWNEHGENNRWDRKIAIYSREKDRTVKYMCPDCNEEWDR
jgi:hypothetical protein